jgi:hypothetical protein
VLELVHTSAPRGLDGRGPGYVTVAMTEGMDPTLARALASESGASLPPRAGNSPSCVVRLWSPRPGAVAITRIVSIDADHAGRMARLAHHVVLERDDDPGRVILGMLLTPGALLDAWHGEPRLLARRHAPITAGSGSTAAFGDLTDHPNAWARHLASVASARDGTSSVAVVPPGTPINELVAAIVAASPDASLLRIETSTERVGTARPPLLLLEPAACAPGLRVVADWSERRGVTAPPASSGGSSDTRPAPSTDPAATRAELDLSRLPPPPRPRAMARREEPATARHRQAMERDESSAGTASRRGDTPSTLPIIAAYAAGAALGAAATALASALWP